MTRVLLTGGSGFIAAHVLETLLQRGHSVVTTVRSSQKGRQILDAHPNHARGTLDYTIVEDIAQLDAFEKAVVSEPPFEAVVHCASPFHFKVQDNKKELLEPAINGTVGLLQAIYKNAPTVKRVVVTSSSAAMLDTNQPTKTYSEEDWCPVTEEQALGSAVNGYRASKTFAERAAWKFVEDNKPNFALSVCNPPLVLGPVIHHLESLSAVNTSNQRIRDLMSGASKDALPYTGNHLWVDVRDLALGHALAFEKPETAGKRFFVVAGQFSNKDVAEIIRDEFPEYRDNLPVGDALKSGDYPARGVYGFDNSRSREVLGLSYRPLRESIVEAVRSLQPLFKE